MSYQGISNYKHDSIDALGILVCNLGTPDAPTPEALRRYLKEFLSDPRVIEMPRWLWWLILNGVILQIRPKKSAHMYQSVWTDEGAPLLAISLRQAVALQIELEQRLRGPVRVVLAMRYGNPSIAAGLAQLREANVRRVLVLPLYPQYSAPATASVFDAVVDELKTWRWLPELRFINDYCDDPALINALAASIREHFDQHGMPQQLLFSFHGTPKRYFINGDPYYCQCQKTARLVAEKLGLTQDQWQVTFQSRFGREEWLKPYTDKTLEALPGKGIKRVAVVCPGFSADCLETLEEIAVTNRAFFLEAGGERYDYIPALNDRADHIQGLADLVLRHVQGWPEADPNWNASQATQVASERGKRADKLKKNI